MARSVVETAGMSSNEILKQSQPDCEIRLAMQCCGRIEFEAWKLDERVCRTTEGGIVAESRRDRI